MSLEKTFEIIYKKSKKKARIKNKLNKILCCRKTCY